MNSGGKCDFVLAIIKGIVEHDDGTAYFGSLMGYLAYETDGIARGLLMRGPKVCRDGSYEFTLTVTRVTEAGRKAYDEYHLERLPMHKGGRAYAWDWTAINE